MVDVYLFTQYISITTVVVCFLIGFIIKNYTKLDNKLIPLIMFFAGIMIKVGSAYYNGDIITPMLFVSGALSGLASSGAYDMIAKSLWLNINAKKND